MNKIKRLLKDWKVVTLLVFLVFSIIAINPNTDTQGVLIRSIESNSPANIAGIVSDDVEKSLLARERIIYMQDKEIEGLEDYYSVLQNLQPGQKVKLTTKKKSGFFGFDTNTYTINLPLSNQSNYSIDENPLGLLVSEVPTSNIILGLDLQGGISVLLQPVEKVNATEYDTLVRILGERMNVQGLKDVVVRKTSNLLGDDFIQVQVAGATKKEVEELLAQQGKFEAFIGNTTIFTGQDVKNIPRSSAMITQCGQSSQNQFSCSYQFSVTLSVEASKKRAEITKDMAVVPSTGGDSYLSENITFYLDDVKINELRISSNLKGSDTTQTSISGYGLGITEREAQKNAIAEMEKLQTILYTGKLPVQLEIVDFSEISPKLGKQFLENSLLVGILALLAVALVVYLRFKKLVIALPMMFTMLSEVTLLLGFAALTRWNIDLAAIAGIIIAAGTGVDDQIVIIDEVLKGEKKDNYTHWSKRIKNAFFIIMAAYFTTLVAMLPLLRAGAGQLRGFATTTIIGISIGVFLTRPAFATIIKEFLADKK